MADDQNTSLAGGAELPPPSASASILDAMGDDDVAGGHDTSDEDEGQPEPEPVEIEEPSAEAQDEDDAEEGGDEDPEDDASEPKPKTAQDEDDETGTRVHRLRDGTQVTLADLKRGYDRAREIEQRVIPAIQAERARIEQDRQAVAAQHQQFQPILAQVATILQQQVPPAATDEMWDSDPIGAQLQDRAHQKALTRLQQVNQAQAEAQQRAAYDQQAREQAYLAHQKELLVQAMPALRERDKAVAFNQSFHEVGREVGFSEQELTQVYDHRLFKLAELAADGLRARKAAQQSRQQVTAKQVVARAKVADAPPVAKPAARQSAGVRQAVTSRGKLEKLAKTGSPRDAEDFLSRFE